MITEVEKFEKVKEFLWSRPCDFCVVYQVEKSILGLKFKWCKAASLNKRDRDGYNALAGKYQKVAEDCYRHKRNLVLKENLARKKPQGQRWLGLKLSKGADDNPLPANELGRRWWHIVVGAGAIRDAGYVIVARVAAKESKEANDCIDGIQQIWSN
jgi:hypothetical protein